MREVQSRKNVYQCLFLSLSMPVAPSQSWQSKFSRPCSSSPQRITLPQQEPRIPVPDDVMTQLQVMRNWTHGHCPHVKCTGDGTKGKGRAVDSSSSSEVFAICNGVRLTIKSFGCMHTNQGFMSQIQTPLFFNEISSQDEYKIISFLKIYHSPLVRALILSISFLALFIKKLHAREGSRQNIPASEGAFVTF